MLNAILEALLGMLVVGTLTFIVFLPFWGFLWYIFDRLSESGVRGCASGCALELIGMAVLLGIAWAGFKACGF